MEIYIEYAFLENFLFDGVLLALALFASKTKIKLWRITVSACVGAGFALLFPFLGLPAFLKTILKISVGFLLCILAFGRLKTKKEWGRYALSTVFFFCCSFGFGGALLGVYGQFQEKNTRTPAFFVFVGFALLSLFSLYLIKKLYARRSIFQSVYPCRVQNGNKQREAQGFLDSGNLAMKNGLPVCFLSPDLFYDLFGEEIIEKSEGQVCDEIEIFTLAGYRKVLVCQGEIELMGRKIQVYLAPSANMIKREYQILLNGKMLGETYEMD